MARDFNKLEIFNLSYSLCLDLYSILPKLPQQEHNNLQDQIRRAATSVPLNIAEGTSRFSKKAFLQFIDYAYGSCKELQVCIELCLDLGYISNAEYTKLKDKLQILSVKIYRFMITSQKENFHDFFEQSSKKRYFKS